MPTKINFS